MNEFRAATDVNGYPVSLDDAAARDAWAACSQGFLAHAASTPDHLAATLSAAPDFAMGWAAKGFFLLLLGRVELRPAALEAYAAARAGRADAREGAYVEALGLALDGKLRAAADRLDAALARWPRDAVAAKLSHGIRFVLGDCWGMRRSIEAAAPAFAEAHPLAGYIHGCRAFALEETGDYASAEVAGVDALRAAPDDAWGLHAVAHVFEMTARPVAGAAWLEGTQSGWRHCNNFGAHVWWHLALFRIDSGEPDGALALYDEKVRADRADDYRDIANAASLLARLEGEGVSVGDRWEELADLAENRIDEGCNVFADLHYLLSLSGAGRTAQARRMAARIAADAARGGTDMEQVAGLSGAQAASGLAAFAEAEWREAHEGLSRAGAHLQRIGGSHAQRDVFARLTIDAALRGGMLGEAEAALSERARKRGVADGYDARRRAAIAARRAAA